MTSAGGGSNRVGMPDGVDIFGVVVAFRSAVGDRGVGTGTRRWNGFRHRQVDFRYRYEEYGG